MPKVADVLAEKNCLHFWGPDPSKVAKKFQVMESGVMRGPHGRTISHKERIATSKQTRNHVGGCPLSRLP